VVASSDLRPVGRHGLLAVVLLGALAACGDSRLDTNAELERLGQMPRGDVSSVEQLNDWTFVSTRVSGYTLAPGTEVRLMLDDGRITATAGCTTMTGEFESPTAAYESANSPGRQMDARPKQPRRMTGLPRFSPRAPTSGSPTAPLAITGNGSTVDMAAQPNGKASGRRSLSATERGGRVDRHSASRPWSRVC
jgi:hypothetical protein